MRTVSHYGIHNERGVSWLQQDRTYAESAVGLPDEELFEPRLLVHPKVLRRCPHAYDIGLNMPRGGELAKLIGFLTLEPFLKYMLPMVHPVGTHILLRVPYEVAAPVSHALELLERFHRKVDPIRFPATYFDPPHRSISAEAERTNVMPLVIEGFSRKHMRKLSQFSGELNMSPRCTIVVSPVAVIATGSFISMEPTIMYTTQFINFLETADLPRLGAEYLRAHMRGIDLT